MYNKDEIKQSLTIEQIEHLVSELGGEPMRHGNLLICRTICHDGESHKLYYYANTTLFKCFTDCSETFDIFDLVLRINKRKDKDYNLVKAIKFVAQKFGFIEGGNDNAQFFQRPEDELFKSYDRIKEIDLSSQIVELKSYETNILNFLPHPRIGLWEQEHIAPTIMEHRGICYDPVNAAIVIPHYDIHNNLVGIRERALIEANEIYGKYRPAKLSGILYNHPLSFNLYNINWVKDNVGRMKKAVVFEGEKSCLLYASYYGEENDISVAVCGSNLINYQAKLLIDLGVDEIIVAFDRQYQEVGDNEFKKLVRNLTQVHQKYGHFVNISFAFDKWNLLPYKASPIDEGKEIFETLLRERVNLY